MAAPRAVPTPIQTGSFVKANIAAPIPTPAPNHLPEPLLPFIIKPMYKISLGKSKNFFNRASKSCKGYI